MYFDMEISMYRPKISIVIPAYNASNYLSEAIDSALAQTYPNIEIIVVNDGSKDDGATREVAMSYGDNIRYFEKENGGSSSALNMGIANMTGEWFSWLSHDDLYVPEKIEKQIEYINLSKIDAAELSKHIFFSASELIDANGKTVRACNPDKSRSLKNKIEAFPHNGHLIAEPTEYLFHGCSCLVHKEGFADVGTFDENLRLLNDVDLWYRFQTADYKIHYLPEPLVKGRVHAKQVSKSIGYSYHNPEQDMFWKRSLNWLKVNCSNEYRLFIKYGCNAYMKTRNQDGKDAFAYAKALNPKCSMEILIKKIYCICYAKIQSLLKQIYIKVKMDGK